MTFSAVNGDAEFLVDPVPRVIAGGEWERLERGVAQRLIALNRFLADGYGARDIVAAGVMEERVIETRRALRAGTARVACAARRVDRRRGPRHRARPVRELLVLEDNLTTPSGFGYAVAARDAVLAALEPPERPRRARRAAELLRGALHAVARVDQPRCVVLTDGAGNSAHWEHRWAAQQLGIPLVEPGDLELRGDRLHHGGRPVDVVYRRTDADRLDSDVGRLLRPALGTLGVVNAFGAGRGRRQARARLRRGHGPLLPGRGAAAALRRRRSTWPAPSTASARSTRRPSWCSSRATATAAPTW